MMENKSNDQKDNSIKDDKQSLELFVTDNPEKLPTVKRLMQTLDKFLTRRFLSLIGLYALAMVVCGAVLITSNTSNAFGGEPSANGLKTVEVWMYSLMVTFSFVFFLLAVRIIAIKRRNKQAK